MKAWRKLLLSALSVFFSSVATAAERLPAFVLYGYDRAPYALDAGPHLFLDWRYIMPGHARYVFPDGKEAPRYDGDPQTLPTILGLPSQPAANIRLAVRRAEKIGPMLDNDQPWEYGIGYHTLLRVSGKYKLWYEVATPRDSKLGGVLCYAESDDATDWTKPKLGLIDFGGNKDNNIVYGEPIAGHSFHGHSVFLDATAPAGERFKLIYMASSTEQEIAAFKAAHPISVSPIGEKKKSLIRLAHSPDGIHWTPRGEPLMSHMSDTQTTVYYDQRLRRYVAYFRLSYMNHRAIGRTEAADLKAWPIPNLTLFPEPMHDRPGDDYYISGYSRYPGTRTMHLMIATIFKRHTDSTALALASSMDGEHWTWLPGGPVVEPGPDGSWDGGCIFGGIGLTELPDGRIASPYVGYVYPHKFPRYQRHMGRIGLAVWPSERLVALEAEEDGEFITGPLAGKGQRLFLNFETKRNGYVKVAIEKAAGRSIETCDPLFGDQLKRQVTWHGQETIGIAPGGSFTLHFKLRAAKLYSFELR
jgi:hypothetical protein